MKSELEKERHEGRSDGCSMGEPRCRRNDGRRAEREEEKKEGDIELTFASFINLSSS